MNANIFRVIFIKAYAYDRIKNHLRRARKDKRHKERMRARIAMKHISGWFKEGKSFLKKMEDPCLF